MRYITFVKMVEDIGDPPPALIEAMGQEMAEAFADGSIVDAGGLWSTKDSTEVRLSAGAITITDGPFAEAKEVVGGFNLIEADSLEEAERIAAGFPWTRTGSIEVRPVREVAAVRKQVGAA